MLIFDNWPQSPTWADKPVCVLTIGTFDGLHLGHKYIIDRVVTEARQLEALPLLLTFKANPLATLAPAAAPPLLMTFDDKAVLLAQWGIEAMGVMDFNQDLAETLAQDFLTKYVEAVVTPKMMVVGPDFCFGRNAEGNGQALKAWGAKRGIETVVANVLTGHEDGLYSSSQIRQALKNGLVEIAMRALGRPYKLTGTVVRGFARGRQLGFPTANVDQIETVVPAPGVYACWAVRSGEVWPAMTAIGYNPTFNGRNLTVEANLIGFDGDLYDQTLSLEFVAKVRDNIRFSGVDKLVNQLRQDEIKIKGILEKTGKHHQL